MPANGASRTRLEIGTPPISKGSVRAGWAAPCSTVALMDQPQPFQGEQVVDLVDRLGEGDHRRGVTTGGEQPRVRQFLFDAADDAVDQAGEAEDEARVDR